MARRRRGPTNRVSAGVGLTYPLMQGRGAAVVDAREEAASQTVRAEQFDRRAEVARVALRAAEAYWAYVAAVERLSILRDAESRAESLLEETKVLVDKDERPAAALDQLRANLGDKRNQRIQAQQSVADAREQLGIVMGVSAQHLQSLEIARRDFPTAPDSIRAQLSDPSAYVATALDERDVLKAAQRREQAARSTRRAAREQADPRLDLSLDAAYAGWVQGGGAGGAVSVAKNPERGRAPAPVHGTSE